MTLKIDGNQVKANRPVSSMSGRSLMSDKSVLPSMASTSKKGEIVTDVIDVIDVSIDDNSEVIDEIDEEEPEEVPVEGKESANRYCVVVI